MRTKLITGCIYILMCTNLSTGQGVAIGPAGSQPAASAILDVQSSSKGMLLPRLTTEQQNNILDPAVGLLVLNMDSLEIYLFDGSVWTCVGQKTKTLSHCSKTFVYESKSYSTIQIGTQCWMKQNLNVGVLLNGSSAQTNNTVKEKHCYNNLEDSCTEYGGLYQWNEMMQYTTDPGATGICPAGFHIPTTTEWLTLADYLGGEAVAGGKLKEAGYRHWKSPNTGATNASNFSALGGGTYRPFPYNYFYLIRESGIYWTSSLATAGNVWREDLNYPTENISPYSCEKEHSFSVRCIRD